MVELPDRWQELGTLFDRALDQPEDQRQDFLDREVSDPDLRREVEELLAADASADADRFFLDTDLVRPEGPRVAGAYELIRKIGEGGTSEVWLGLRADRQFRRRVAVKLLRSDGSSQEMIERLGRERQILANLDHLNIARLFDSGTTAAGRPYVVMELVEGEPITDFCDHQRLDIDQRLTLFRSLCAAVHTAHKNLVVHRDLKPSNVLVTREGVPKLVDFGIAKWLDPGASAAGSAPTQPWQRLLTPDYASPEQIQGRSVATPSDVYSLGVLLYELLTGRLPRRFGGLRPAEVERRLERDGETPLASAVVLTSDEEGPSAEELARVRQTTSGQLARRLAGDLDIILRKALAGAPAERYESAVQLADDLQRHQEGRPVAARPPTARYRVGRLLRRHRRTVLASAAFLVLLLASSIGLGVLSLRLAEERNQAAIERDKARLFARLLRDVFEVADPGEANLELTAREILRRGAERVAAAEIDSPEVEADLVSTLGNVNRRLGLYDEARPLLESALTLRRRSETDDPLPVAESLVDLGSLLRDAGDYVAAETYFDEALLMRRQTLGEDHPEVLASRKELALLARNRGQYDAAEVELRQLVEELEQRPDSTPEILVEVRSILAGLLHQKGLFEEAEALHRKVVARYRELYGDRHAATALALNNLASSLIDQGRFEEPEPLLIEALEIYRALKWDENHPTVISSLSNLGALATFQRDFAKAEGYYREAQDRATVSMGLDHPNLSYILSGLGAARRQLGDLRGAEEALRRATDIRRRSFGPGHLLTSRAEALLGACLRDQGKFQEAETLLLSVARLYSELEPPRVREQTRVAEHLVELYEAIGDETAAARHREVLDRLRASSE